MLKLYGPMVWCLLFCASAGFAGCNGLDNASVSVQVLGSGGPELSDKRASSSYLIWHQGKAKLLVDVGSGSLLNAEKTDANLNDITGIMLSHLHVDHTADLPAFIKASFFADRTQDLMLLGPSGNALMPSTTTFINTLFGKQGAYRYLSSYLDGSDQYQLKPQNINTQTRQTHTISRNGYQLTAVPVHHGAIPALAWQVKIGGKTLIFSGDMNGAHRTLAHLAHHADLMIAHHAVPETAKGVARHLHMPPSVIGQLASQAKVKQLVLSHHMQRTLDGFDATKKQIAKSYQGPLHFADDLDCFTP